MAGREEIEAFFGDWEDDIPAPRRLRPWERRWLNSKEEFVPTPEEQAELLSASVTDVDASYTVDLDRERHLSEVMD